MNNALWDSKYVRLSNAVAGGTGTTNCVHVDMDGHDAVEFGTAIGTIDATGTVDVKVQQGAAADDSDMADLAGSKISYTAADDNKLAIHDLYRPTKRYVRVVIVRATANGVIDAVWARLYHTRQRPTSQSSTYVVGSKLLCSPAEGTP